MPEPCDICGGKAQTCRTKNMKTLMCKKCWRTVPLALRKENERWRDKHKLTLLTGHENMSFSDRAAWAVNVGKCRNAALEARGL